MPLRLNPKAYQTQQQLATDLGLGQGRGQTLADLFDVLMPAAGPSGMAASAMQPPQAPMPIGSMLGLENATQSDLFQAAPPGLEKLGMQALAKGLSTQAGQTIGMMLLPMMLGRATSAGQKSFKAAAKPLRERLKLSKVKNRVFHGTTAAFEEFDPQLRGKGAGGDLYGPGFYFTENPRVAGGDNTAIEDLRNLGYATPRMGQEISAETILKEFAGASKESRDEAVRFARQYIRETGLGAEDIHVVKRGDNYIVRKAEPVAPNVRPAYLDIRKPFDIEGQIPFSKVDELLQKSGIDNAVNDKDVVFARRGVNADYGMSGQSVYEVLHKYLSKDKINDLLQANGYDGITHIGGSGKNTHRVWIAFSPDQVIPAYAKGAPTSTRAKAGGRQ